MSCNFTRDACQKNLLMFLFQWRAWRQPGLANRSYSLHRIHATAVCGVLRALQGCVAEGQGIHAKCDTAICATCCCGSPAELSLS